MHTYYVKHLNKTYDILVDEKIKDFKHINVHRDHSGNFRTIVFMNDGRRISMSMLLYGYIVEHINGNYFDFRKCNCRLQTAADYNIKYRKYENNHGYIGVVKNTNKYGFRVCRNNEVYYSGSKYNSPLDASIARQLYISGLE